MAKLSHRVAQNPDLWLAITGVVTVTTVLALWKRTRNRSSALHQKLLDKIRPPLDSV
jgi:hypothetical protein